MSVSLGTYECVHPLPFYFMVKNEFGESGFHLRLGLPRHVVFFSFREARCTHNVLRYEEMDVTFPRSASECCYLNEKPSHVGHRAAPALAAL